MTAITSAQLTPADLSMFAGLGIPAELLAQAGVRRVTDSNPSNALKPSELGFDGFDGRSPSLFPITQDLEEVSQHKVNAIEKSGGPQPSEPSEPPNDVTLSLVPTTDGVTETSFTCPAMPKGVRLIHWEPKAAPVAIDVCSVVVDVSRFLESELRALDSRLNNPWTIHGGFTVPQILDRLAQAGLEVELNFKGGE